jgi:MFS transporter, DHA2 family, multidrug resistance protein
LDRLFFFAQYLQLVAGLSALEAGILSLPSAIAFTLMSFFNTWFMARFSNLHVFVGGLLLSALEFLGLGFSNQLIPMVACMVLASVGFTPVVALTTAYIVGSAPPEKAGVASALSETAAELGGALGIALLGSFATLLYRSRVAGSVPADIEGAAQFKTSLASAVQAAKHCPPKRQNPFLTLHVLLS